MNIFSSLGKKYFGYSQVDEFRSASSSTCYIFKSVLDKAVSYSQLALLPTILVYHSSLANYALAPFVLFPFTVILLLAMLYKIQDRLLYHPSVPENSKLYVPLPMHMNHEVVEIETSDHEVLHGYFLKQPDNQVANVPTVAYFHGNAGNAGSPCILPLYALCKMNVLVVDYRGYGKSTGYPSEDGLYIDGKSCIQYLHSRKDIDPNKIVLFGHSMGGAVALHLAARMQDSEYRISAVILENTFTSIPEVARHIFKSILPGISHLPTVCYKNKFLSIDKVAAVIVPILFIRGDKDEIVNPDMTRRLQNASSNSHTILLTVANGTHNDTWCVSHSYHRCVSAFLKKVFNEDLEKCNHEQTSDRFVPETEFKLEWNTEVFSN